MAEALSIDDKAPGLMSTQRRPGSIAETAGTRKIGTPRVQAAEILLRRYNIR
jgi:hypothetical protein